MLDAVQKFLKRKQANLSSLQSVDIGSIAPDSIEAAQLVLKFVEAAVDGDSYALTMCAACYRSGWGVEADRSQAFVWAQKAAAANFAPGLAELGYCYETGVGAKKDMALALRNFNAAIEMGYGVAALHLALRYESGYPYGRSVDESLRNAKIAFHYGEAYAGHLLGTRYETGGFFTRDLRVARYWYEKAAVQGSLHACLRMATAYREGELGLVADSQKSENFLRKAEASCSP